MAIETLIEPKPTKQYTWTCFNDTCSAKLTGNTRDATNIVRHGNGTMLLYFTCPHCKWETRVEA